MPGITYQVRLINVGKIEPSYSMIFNSFLCIIHTAAPTGLDIVVDEQSYVTITWEPPRLARRHGKLLNYSITCSTAHSGSTLTTVTLNTTLEIQLKPYETYQCCVSAVNQMGSGFPSCKLIETNEGGNLVKNNLLCIHACSGNKQHTISIIAPTASPTNIRWLMLNSSSVLLFWDAPPIEHQNGIVRGYHIELSGDNTSLHYTTAAPFLVVDYLMPSIDYNCSVAAYTTERGPFSEPTIVSLENQIVSTQMNTNNACRSYYNYTNSGTPLFCTLLGQF